jgi:2-(1,2-epoxy-1,2-dihydrophenyl)acetyl-CoA isomerase
VADEGTEVDREILRTEVRDRIATITLNRPDRRNALNGHLILALDDAVKAMAGDPEVKVVILTGAAPEGALGGFCSGGDTKDGGVVPDPARADAGVPPDALAGDLSRHDRHAAMLLHQMPKPTIAMVGGPAIGAGFSLAGACDLRIASDQAVFGAMFANNGLSGDYGGTYWWTRILGTARARELFLLNAKVPAARALELGMVTEVVPAEELQERTWAVASRLVRMPASLLGLVKANLNEAEDAIERRRWLFAHEAENQGRAGRDIAARLAARDASASAR